MGWAHLGSAKLSFLFTDTIVVGGEMFEYMMPYTTLSCLFLILVPSIRCACPKNVVVEVTGSNIIDIPRNLRSDLDYLIVSRTNIHTLNLTVVIDYPEMCRLDISKSLVNHIITPSVPHNSALISLHLYSGHFPTLPDLGDVLEGQIERLGFFGMGIVTIPDNYFENFTRLTSLSLAKNRVSNINAGNMAGLSQLQDIYLGHNQLNPLPSLHLWLPILKRLSLHRNGISLLPASLMDHLPNLLLLNMRGNELSTVPSREHFVNLDNMVLINLEGNPLHCDNEICWIKVIPISYIHEKEIVILPMIFIASSIS